MNRFVVFGIRLAYEALTTLLPFLAVFLLGRKRQKKNGTAFSRYHVFAVLVFSVYVLGVYHFTGVSTLYDHKRYIFIPELINLVPFSNEIDIVAYALNVVLFVPFGLLLPMIWQNMGKLRSVLLGAFGFTLLIEVSQLLNFRSTDIDDVILNLAGMTLGFLVCHIGAALKR